MSRKILIIQGNSLILTKEYVALYERKNYEILIVNNGISVAVCVQ